jgi:uncharacterized protein YdhG (YjbR/CyaY superfamily)
MRGKSSKSRKRAVARDVDDYIARAPRGAKSMLSQLRTIIRSTAPEAEEGISWGLPYYKYYGPLTAFAAFKNHIGFQFPDTISNLSRDFKDELRGYETGEKRVRFTIGKPLPVALIKMLLRAQMLRNEAEKRK